MSPAERFALRYGACAPLLSILGLGPNSSVIELRGERLRVRMGWGFAADVSRASIRSRVRDEGAVGGIGVHGWRGRWLVNGAASGLVTLEFEPEQRARVLGVSVRLRRLRISLEDPGAFLAALG